MEDFAPELNSSISCKKKINTNQNGGLSNMLTITDLNKNKKTNTKDFATSQLKQKKINTNLSDSIYDLCHIIQDLSCNKENISLLMPQGLFDVKHDFDLGPLTAIVESLVEAMKGLSESLNVKEFSVNHAISFPVLDSIKLTLNSLFDKATTIIKTLLNIADEHFIKICAISILTQLCCLKMARSNASRMLLAQKMLSFLTNMLIGGKLCFVYASYQDDSVDVPQSGDSAAALCEYLAGFCVLAITYLSIPNYTDFSKFFSTIREAVSKMPSMEKGVMWFITFIVQAIQYVSNKILSALGREKIDLLGNKDPELTGLLNEIKAYVAQQEDKPDYSTFAREILLEFQDRLEHKREDLVRSKYTAIDKSEMFKKIDAVTIVLKTNIKRLLQAGVSGGSSRFEPLGLAILGSPGVGKSSIMKLIHNEIIMEQIGSDQTKYLDFLEHEQNYIYHRFVDNEYHDGYMNQIVYNIDDFGQNVDSVGAPASEFAELIRAVNTAPYVLHMAAVEDKGLRSFHSHLVSCTSNLAILRGNVNSIIEPKALARRLHITYYMSIKPEFCTRNTGSMSPNARVYDVDRFGPIEAKIEDNFSHVEFIPWDFVKGVAAIGLTLSADGFISHVLECYKDKTILGLNTAKAERDDRIRRYEEKFGIKLDVPKSKLLDAHNEKADELVKLYSRWLPAIANDGAIELYNYLVYKMPYTSDEVYKLFKEYSEDSKPKDLADALIIQARIHKELVKPNTYFNSGEYKDALDSCSAAIAIRTHSLVSCICAIEAVLVFTAAYIGLSIAIDWANGDKPRVNPFSSQSEHRAKTVVPRTKRVVKLHPQVNHTQGNCLRLFDNNVCMLEINAGEVWQKLGYAIFVRRSIAILPCHILNVIDQHVDETGEDIKLRITRCGTKGAYFELLASSLKAYTDVESDTDDFLLVDFTTVQHFRDITKMLMTNEDFIKLRNGRNFTTSIIEPLNGSYVLQNVTTNCKDNSSYGYNNEHSFMEGFEYYCATQKGMCGLPLFGDFAHAEHRILLGFHVSGDGATRGQACRLDRDRILAILDILDVTDPFEVSDYEVALPVLPESNTITIGKLPYSSHTPKRSSIVKSTLCDFKGPSPNKPAMLIRTNNRDPWLVARAKYNKPSRILNPNLLHVVANDYFSHVLSVSSTDPCNPSPYSILTFDQAVMGIPGLAFMSGVDRSTSSGYPYSCGSLGSVDKSKRLFFGDSDWVLDNEFTGIVRNATNRLIQLAKRGIRTEVVYQDVLKDEVRPIAKVDSGKTRLISSSPLAYSLAVRQYTMSFTAWFMRNNVVNSSAVGINAWGHDWTRLANFLRFNTDRSNKVIAGDFSNFDGSLTSQIINQTKEFIKRFYSQGNIHEIEFSTVIDTLFYDMTNSHHIVGNTLYCIESGMPSGNPLTTIINTVSNNILLRYAMVMYLNEQIPPHYDQCLSDLKYIRDNVSIVCYGDDNVISVSDKCTIDQESLTISLGIMGYTYTDDNKSANNYKYRTYDNVTFLKRSFILSGNCYLAPLIKEVIIDMVRWKKRSSTHDDFMDIIDASLCEMTLHGQDFYDELSAELQAYAAKHGVFFTIIPHNMMVSRLTSLQRNF